MTNFPLIYNFKFFFVKREEGNGAVDIQSLSANARIRLYPFQRFSIRSDDAPTPMSDGLRDFFFVILFNVMVFFRHSL